MHPVDAVRALGGVASSRDVLAQVTRRELRAAVECGDVQRLSRDRYGLAGADSGMVVAARLSGVASHLSAAQAHRWPVLDLPTDPQVVVPRHRTVRGDAEAVELRYRDLAADEVVRRCLTSPLRTVLDCARDLDWAAALAVADSALRAGDVSTEELRAAAALARGPGSVQVRRVAAEADQGAANPFESALRALCLDVPGLEVEPQVEVRLPGLTIHPDLVDPRLRLLVEAESHMFHASAPMLLRDCERYTLAAAAGWRVARFGYFHVRKRQDWVREVLGRLVAGTPGMAQGCSCGSPGVRHRGRLGCAIPGVRAAEPRL